ncbi:L,D-transpeptidase family protein [Novosphingobium aquae]|uniref:L,D-transpeptidase family protein n=1 Tax=Novosphingobium aquae TaxID=3133435 RepID=A0ABU8SDE3_9SPHN
MVLGAKGWGAVVAAVGGVVVAGAALISLENPASNPPQAIASAPPAVPANPAPVDERFVIKRVLPITGPIKYGEWHWDEAGVPDGPLVMTVDLEARVLSVFRGGYEIAATAVLLGTTEKPTPLGVFPVNWKKADHYSRTYDNAPMPFTLNLTTDGVAIHGTKVENGYASHGCIGVPTPFAQKLFALAKVGDKVYVTRGKQTGVGQSLTES